MWSKVRFDFFKVFKDNCLTKIKELDGIEEDRSLSKDEKNLWEKLRHDFQIEALREETFWMKRSKVKWRMTKTLLFFFSKGGHG